jgi:dipeptidyl aminopeptidase/acylaminoacyl peptidase
VWVLAATSAGITPSQITHLNDNAPKNTHKVESVEWTSDNFHVQGWLTYPKNYDPHKKYPMIVEVHGGPSASAGPDRNTMYADLGYFQFAPNPRGSFGQGEAFTAANVKDFGYGDLRDILAGVDALEKRLPIDDHRLGLTGWSYGGFMTMFGVTQTHRFRAAVAGAGISDWLSYYGENSIDQWMTPFFGASVYDDPAVYAKSSAITFIKNVTTPTLVIVGDRDGECPAPQSFEFWHALRAEGVNTQLVIYPNEGHGFRNPEHIKDRNEREVKWFAENMPEGKE